MFGDPRLPDRFWDKVMTEPNTGCWLWTGEISHAGFGKMRTSEGRSFAHRLSFDAFVGSGGKFARVFQRCGERSCCNPAHLYKKPERTRDTDREYQRRWAKKKRRTDPRYKERRDALNRKLYAKDPTVSRSATRRWQQQNPDKVRQHAAAARLRRYGLTPQEYADIMNRQAGKCGVCRTDLSTLNSKFVHIDHCHSSGRVRGILCTNCNSGLGHFDDDEQRLLGAVAYLKGGAP